MGSRLHGGEVTVKALDPLTLDAVGAAAIAHHLQRGECSHFNAEVSETQRLAELGELIGKIFQSAALVPDSAKLQQDLLWLSATSAIWAELIDKRESDMVRFTDAAMTVLRQNLNGGGIIK